MRGLNKFLRNKNTVTILGIILIVFLLFIGFNVTINQTVNPISIPVAKQTIPAQTKITGDMLQIKKISKVSLTENVVRNAAGIVGKYTNINVTIPAGSMIYTEWLADEDSIPGNWIEKIDISKGEEAYYYHVDMVSTFGNSILPDSHIDIYMSAKDANGNIMYGKLFSSIKVLAVHDSNGKNVFADPANVGSPSYLAFGLSRDNYKLLKRAEYLKGQGIELVIEPKGQKYVSKAGTLVSSKTLQDYINNATSTVSDEAVEEFVKAQNTEADSVETSDSDTNNTNNSTTTNNTRSLTR